MMPEFTHIQHDRAQMVDISGKSDVTREAVASGRIYLKPETLAAIHTGTVVKGNVLATARVAATMAVKNTATIIPMCHPIPISSIAVDFTDGERNILGVIDGKTTRSQIKTIIFHWEVLIEIEMDEINAVIGAAVG
jgi:cyclic pyranopterin phosphate synthase